MQLEVVYALLSVIIVSLVSLVGVFTISINKKLLKKFLIYLVSFSAGALMGDVFIHLIPEAAEAGFTLEISIFILSGILFSFILEKFIFWRHCHIHEKDHIHSFAYINFVGDAIHNFIDGLIIAGSYLVSLPVGIATTLAVIFHEIPQEVGDFGVLIHGGFSRKKALTFNFITALTAILGAVIAFSLASYIENFIIFLVPFAAGNLIYIAGSDLIPELHRETARSNSLLQLISLIFGICIMILLLSFG